VGCVFVVLPRVALVRSCPFGRGEGVPDELALAILPAPRYSTTVLAVFRSFADHLVVTHTIIKCSVMFEWARDLLS